MPLDPSKDPNDFLAQILDKITGDEKPQGDELYPTTGPLDLLPYEKAAPLIGKGAKELGSFANLKNILGNETGSIGKEVFDPNNAKHMAVMKPFLVKNVPPLIDNNYTDGQILHELLKDKSIQKNILNRPEVERSISDAGFESSPKLPTEKSSISTKAADAGLDTVAATAQPTAPGTTAPPVSAEDGLYLTPEDKFSLLKRKISN